MANARIPINMLLFVFLISAIPTIAHGQSAAADPASHQTTIHTPKGTPVEAVIYEESLSGVQISYMNDQWLTNPLFRDAKIVSDATNTYNCHGYTWYMSDGGQGRLHIDDPWPYLEDGSYEIIEENEVREGDKVMYGDGVHSAVIADEPGWAISKWGDGPLMRHGLREVPPEFGSDLELTFYRKASRPAAPLNLRIVQQ